MKTQNMKAIVGLIVALVVVAAVIFLSAWTLHYWQACVFLAVFFVTLLAMNIFLMKNDPRMLEKRSKIVPSDENGTGQRIINVIGQVSILFVIVLPVLDHRFGWSIVPLYLNIVGDLLIALGIFFVILVFKENTYAAPLIELSKDQKVISTGPYAVVRHPMYSSALIWFLGVPLALGSAWGVLLLIPMTLVFIWRLRGEEKFLSANLPGYTEYKNKVRYRLVPLLW